LKLHASVDLAYALEVARQIDCMGWEQAVKAKDAEYSKDSSKNSVRRMLVILKLQ